MKTLLLSALCCFSLLSHAQDSIIVVKTMSMDKLSDYKIGFGINNFQQSIYSSDTKYRAAFVRVSIDHDPVNSDPDMANVSKYSFLVADLVYNSETKEIVFLDNGSEISCATFPQKKKEKLQQASQALTEKSLDKGWSEEKLYRKRRSNLKYENQISHWISETQNCKLDAVEKTIVSDDGFSTIKKNRVLTITLEKLSQ
jgi:hypothetical protein